MKKTIILAIETSCDDTSLAILESSSPEEVKILAHLSFSSEEILAEWGGIVPEIAARNHLEKLHPLLEKSFEITNLESKNINLLAVTTHPGLLGPLLTGLNTIKTLALYLKLPIVSVNHLYAHLEAIFLTEQVSYPYLGLLISGGHSLFLKVSSPFDFEFLGGTIDDAAGEAFDKGGKLLGFKYPAGKAVDEYAKKGNRLKYKFPIGLEHSHSPSLSYSGLKTALRFHIEKNSINGEQDLYDLCASYQESIANALKIKLQSALNITGTLPIVIGGGVALNSRVQSLISTNFSDVHFVNPKFCTDNAAMVANYALRTQSSAIPFPECLTLDAQGTLSRQRPL